MNTNCIICPICGMSNCRTISCSNCKHFNKICRGNVLSIPAKKAYKYFYTSPKYEYGKVDCVCSISDLNEYEQKLEAEYIRMKWVINELKRMKRGRE